MRSLVIWAAAITLLAGAALGTGAPLGPRDTFVKDKVEPYAAKHYLKKFEANRRASVIALGSVQAGGFLALYVYDAQGNCVAWDDRANYETGDGPAVEWVPPQAGFYSIELKCLGRRHNEFVMTVRQDKGQ